MTFFFKHRHTTRNPCVNLKILIVQVLCFNFQDIKYMSYSPVASADGYANRKKILRKCAALFTDLSSNYDMYLLSVRQQLCRLIFWWLLTT